jgi:hypothetical protein
MRKGLVLKGGGLDREMSIVAVPIIERSLFGLLDEDHDNVSCATEAVTVQVSNVFPERRSAEVRKRPAVGHVETSIYRAGE